jgi:hypothetical protein
VCALMRVNREHQFRRRWKGPNEAGPRLNRDRGARNRVVGAMRAAAQSHER